ncbi:MAG: hypothetical protein ACSLFB_08240 [Acidimicrobiales bacterium]
MRVIRRSLPVLALVGIAFTASACTLTDLMPILNLLQVLGG